ncbi:hypothetical protein OPT61_g9297 [Boeremia exigua]|uniref:Uncharacterized protein n=1 Tax=Boeremia exigua TaxID=749465 RepID=A0ACC2HV33_9PLEO|nr:hypothetical protein OPT61_g9297 [Boeremia exigua]
MPTHDTIQCTSARAVQPKNKQADRHEEGHDQRGNQAALWRAQTVCADRRVDAAVDVEPVPRQRQGDADSHAEEGEAHLAQVEAVGLHVHDREGFEEGVEDAVDDGGVDGGEGDAGV